MCCGGPGINGVARDHDSRARLEIDRLSHGPAEAAFPRAEYLKPTGALAVDSRPPRCRFSRPESRETVGVVSSVLTGVPTGFGACGLSRRGRRSQKSQGLGVRASPLVLRCIESGSRAGSLILRV